MIIDKKFRMAKLVENKKFTITKLGGFLEDR